MALLLLSLTGCDKDEETPQPMATTFDKQITFHIFTEADYRDSRWNNSNMRLHLQLRRLAQNPHKETVVLDTTISWAAFRDMPSKAASLQFARRLPQVNRLDEQVTVSISKVVSIDGYQTTFAHQQTLQPEAETEVVEVKL